MSTYWNLKCLTCNEENTTEINHGEHRILELWKNRQAIKAFLDVQFSYLTFSYDFAETNFAYFIYQHYNESEHILVARNEYGKELTMAELEAVCNEQIEKLKQKNKNYENKI